MKNDCEKCLGEGYVSYFDLEDDMMYPTESEEIVCTNCIED